MAAHSLVIDKDGKNGLVHHSSGSTPVRYSEFLFPMFVTTCKQVTKYM